MVHAAEISPSEVRLFDNAGIIKSSFVTAQDKSIDGMSIAATDLESDGKTEIIVGSGPDTEPRVYIYNQDGTLNDSFLAYAANYGKGVRLATGDLNGDGKNEIVTGTGNGGGPHIRIFDERGIVRDKGFFAYDKNLRGGVFVNVADLDGDGKAEIITGAGIGGEPKIRIFSGQGVLQSEFLAFDQTELSGVTVGTADINGDGKPEILAGRASSDTSEIKIFSSSGILVKTLTLKDTFKGGINAQGADCNGDGKENLVVSSNGTDGLVQCLSIDENVLRTFEPFSKDFSGAVQVIWTQLSADDTGSLVVAPTRAYKIGNPELAQEIRVSLDEQRIYAYEYGLLVKTFLVSTGIARRPTPPGTYSVLKKVKLKDYIWNYGFGNPDNYELPNVQWNLQFSTHMYLHYAYWHHNFGHRMSHGCVNMPLAPSEWIFNWANVGTPVIIE